MAKRLALALCISLLAVGGCRHASNPPTFHVPTPLEQFDRALYRCFQAPPDEVKCIQPAVHWGRVAGYADCRIRASLEYVGCCLPDILRALQEDTTPKTNFYAGCDEWPGDPCFIFN